MLQKIHFEYISYVSPILVFYLTEVLNLVEYFEIASCLIKGDKINFYMKKNDDYHERPNINPFNHVLRDLAAVNFSTLIPMLFRIVLRFPSILFEQLELFVFIVIYILVISLFIMRIPSNWKIRWKVILANNLGMFLMVMIIDFINIEYKILNIWSWIFSFIIFIIISIILGFLWGKKEHLRRLKIFKKVKTTK